MDRDVKSRSRRWLVILLWMTISVTCAGQHLGLKTNLPYGAFRIPNMGVELALSEHTTLDVWGAYNPFQEQETKKWKLWSVQPELRYWFCRDFSGLFVGLHAGVGQYNIGGVGGSLDLGGLKDHRVQGSFWNGGLSVGRHWILSPRWGLEATIGLGYTEYRYERYLCLRCGELTDKGRDYYLGPTRVGLSLVYMIR